MDPHHHPQLGILRILRILSSKSSLMHIKSWLMQIRHHRRLVLSEISPWAA
jgi:hypothetical protein